MWTNKGKSMKLSRRLAAALVFASWLLGAAPVHAQAASGCQFVLGFAALHAVDAADIGGCLDNQTYAANGDAQQHTTSGLMAWRKADNWTAFTNGYWTWINGPQGLAKRLNTQRFSWEANPTALPLADAPVASPPPVVRTASPISNFTAAWRIFAIYDPVMAQALTQANLLPKSANLPPGVAGAFLPSSGQIYISTSILTYSPDEIAAVIVHEATHELQWIKGDIGVGTACFQLEKEAFDAQKDFWYSLYGQAGKPSATTDVAKNLNALVAMGYHDNLTFLQWLVSSYQDECS
jgi:hypothetical protein